MTVTCKVAPMDGRSPMKLVLPISTTTSIGVVVCAGELELRKCGSVSYFEQQPTNTKPSPC